MFLRRNLEKNQPGCQLLESMSGSWVQNLPACKADIRSCSCLVRWRLNGFPVVLYVERWKGAEYSDLLGSYPFLNRNHSDNNLLRISDVSTSNIFLKHNEMFRHDSLSPIFELFSLLGLYFFYRTFSYLIISYLILSCLVLYSDALYCIV